MRSFLHILKSFSKKEKVVLFTAIALSVVSGLFISINALNRITEKVPSYGGELKEGIIGQPSLINPVFAKDGSIDKDLSVLLFANAIDISESINSRENYTIWNLRIKEGASWHDNTPITSDDIIFTIRMIQDPDAISPLFQDWQHIEVNRVSEREVQFKLSGSYALFPENVLNNLRPIPKKLFADLSPTSLRLSIYNLEPIGSGPYRYKSLTKKENGFIESYKLESNKLYSSIGKLPYIKSLVVKFYTNKDSLIEGYNYGAIDAFYADTSDAIDEIISKSNIFEIPTTKYTAIFLNKNYNSILSNDNIRKALTISVNKERIVKDIYEGKAIETYGPIPPTFSDYEKSLDKEFKYDKEEAEKLLEDANWEYDNESNSWVKEEGGEMKELSITITVPDIPELKFTAEIVSDEWNKIGIKSSIDSIDPSIINEQKIKTRNYESLLIGNILSNSPDMYSFWNSSERFYPGLNMSLYKNDDVDDIIFKIREENPDSEERADYMKILQKIIAEDSPAIFLVSPINFYITRSNIPGVLIERISLPSDRFIDIQNWYTETSRSFRNDS